MKNNRIFLMVMLTVAVILAACGNSSEASNITSDNESENNNLSQNTNDDIDTDNKDENEKDEPSSGDATENASNTDNTDIDINTDNDDTNENIDTSNDVPTKEEDPTTDNTETSLKESYLEKLNDTKNETEEMEATDSSTFAYKKLENDRWDIWDNLLNDIYGVLNEQLPPKEMDQLKEEQRNWINHRDDRALEASLKYKGGTQEHLEYVAVLANVTEERCYELVENYMK